MHLKSHNWSVITPGTCAWFAELHNLGVSEHNFAVFLVQAGDRYTRKTSTKQGIAQVIASDDKLLAVIFSAVDCHHASQGHVSGFTKEQSAWMAESDRHDSVEVCQVDSLTLAQH